VGCRAAGKEEKIGRRLENHCRKGFTNLSDLLEAPGAKKFSLGHCHENQITGIIYSKEIEKTILLNSS